MNRKFSKYWIASKKPGKQRKYLAKAPIHIKRKFLSVNLSKELRKKYQIRNIELRKGDVVKIMRGKFKKKQGKVLLAETKSQKIHVENVQVKKNDGSKVNVKMPSSNLQIIELNLEDRKRMKTQSKKIEKKETKQEEKK